MNALLFNRSLGSTGPQVLQRAQKAQLLEILQPAPDVQFDSNDVDISARSHRLHDGEDAEYPSWAHRAGVNSIIIDRFEGRRMLSGGADSSIILWDLEHAENTSRKFIHRPVGRVQKSSSSHKFGITHLSFYPFDSFAFLSSSFDHSLKIYSTETLTASASFELDSVVYSHAISPIADHLLVACATQHPAVRLVDLRSGANAHSLAGHQGAVLSVAWSPQNENILASGGSDGTVRFWDIRRSASSLGVLDLENSLGILSEHGTGWDSRPRDRGKAHVGACNGVVWSDDGNYVVTAGHDERIRVWDMSTGANTLSHFGPIVKNSHLSTLLPLLVPSNVTTPGLQILLYPNEREILVFDMLDGTLLKRLRIPRVAVTQARGNSGQRNIRHRTTSLAWRSGQVELYSGHSDGVIRALIPLTQQDAISEGEDAEASNDEDDEDGSRNRKRQALEDIYREMTRQKITFT